MIGAFLFMLTGAALVVVALAVYNAPAAWAQMTGCAFPYTPDRRNDADPTLTSQSTEQPL